jgi:hypothetical protein
MNYVYDYSYFAITWKLYNEQVILGTCKALFKRLMAVFSAVIRVATTTD